MQPFQDTLDLILEAKDEYIAAVAIVQNGNKWLLGLARNTNDDRDGRWVFPGGHIKPHETPEAAAVRECREETGVTTKSVGKAFADYDKKNVAFVHCKVTSKNQKLDNNHEFTAIGFFDKKEMKSLKLYKNVLRLIDRVD